MTSPPIRRCFSFSLRRMLLAFALLSVVCAGLRWWYVRVHTQDWVVGELHALGCSYGYAAHSGGDVTSWTSYYDPPPPRARNVVERFRNEAGRVVTLVQASILFRSLADAERANELLRLLPSLERVEIVRRRPEFDTPDYPAREDAQIAALIRGLPIRGVQIQQGFGPETAAEVARLPRLEYLRFWFNDRPPNAADLQTALENPSLRTVELTATDVESVRAVAAAEQLTEVMLFDPPGAELNRFARRRDCKLRLHFREAGRDDLAVAVRLPTLIELGVADTTASDEDLAPLSDCRDLQRLMFSYVPIGDSALQSLRTLPKLRHLRLCGTEVTEAGMIDLAKGRPLQMEFTDNLDLQRIRQACPEAMLHTEKFQPERLRPKP